MSDVLREPISPVAAVAALLARRPDLAGVYRPADAWAATVTSAV